jgi:glutaredoxin
VNAISLTLLTRDGCHLCDEMHALLARVSPELGLRVELRDIDRDPALRSRYGEEVPVLLVNGRKAFKYRVTTAELRRRVRAERRREMLRSWRRLVPLLR